METWNSVVNKSDLAVSVIRPNLNFHLYNKFNFCVDSWCAVGCVHDHCPFKSKPHCDYLGTANRGTAYNLHIRTIGKLGVIIVDDQIRPI